MTRLSITLLTEYENIVLGWVNGGGQMETIGEKETKEENGTLEKKGYLLNTEEYAAALKDTALSVRNYNHSLWLIYDIFKF